MIARRGVLVGGVSALAAAAIGWRAWDRGVGASRDGRAYEAWRDWEGAPGDGLLRPVRSAILAASPHNSQPWFFVVSPFMIEAYADRTRNLGAVDPFRREMQIALGAAIENLAIAAQAGGLLADVAPTEGRLTDGPDGAPFRVARIGLRESAHGRDPLFFAIPRRHTNRGPYLPDTPVAPDVISRLAHVAAGPEVRAAFVTESSARRDLGALIVEATRQLIDDPEMSADSARWFRSGRRAAEVHQDGLTLDASGLSPAMTALAKFLPDMSTATSDEYWLAMTRDVQLPSAPALGILFVRDRLDGPASVAAGRAWQRLHLAATDAGIAAQPLNQPVEVADRAAARGRPDGFASALARFAPEPGWEATFVFRLGRPERPGVASPRRPVLDVARIRM